MALPWHMQLDSATMKTTPTIPKSTLLKHLCDVNIHENPSEELQTGLMCEIGINHKDPSIIQRLIAAGMAIAHLNLSDLEPNHCDALVQCVRQAAFNYSADLEYILPLALIVDIRGPEIITGNIEGGPDATLELFKLGSIKLTMDSSWRECGTSDCLFVGWDQLTDLNEGDIIYIDSLTPSKIKMSIANVETDAITCTVITGGILGSKMAVRISQVPKNVEPKRKSQEDNESSCSSIDTTTRPFDLIDDQVAWAVGSDVDALLISHTREIFDIRLVRDLLPEKARHILIFASIDTVQALDNIDAILAEADGLCFDRAILSTDLPVEKIFIAQKLVIAKCNEIGKPCVCKAIINEQIPTLCVTDIANLVLDGADVLSIEFHYDYPIKKLPPTYDSTRTVEQCLAAASVICKQAERIRWEMHTYGNIELMQSELEEPTRAVCVSAVELAMRSKAVAIICTTHSGRTAKILSHAKPLCPIIAVTRYAHSSRQLRFWRGVKTMHYYEAARGNWTTEVECRVNAAMDYCKAKRILRAGDAYVVLAGSRRGTGYCDTVRLFFASAKDSVPVE